MSWAGVLKAIALDPALQSSALSADEAVSLFDAVPYPNEPSPTPMTSAQPRPVSSVRYSPRTLLRAERAVRCSPFNIALFTTMQWQGVALGAIASDTGVRLGYTRRPISELVAEAELLWLIQVGMLRREVDGQGLTDSFRLTPLGRVLIERWQQRPSSSSAVSWLDRLLNAMTRWIRRPSWLS